MREIVVAPRAAAAGFPLMLRLLGGACVCNSHATRDWIVREQPALATRSSVIWNGLGEVPSAAPEAAARFRQSLGVGEEEVLVALVGRINRWKGQGVLIDAAALLEKQMPRRVRYVIVGDVADDQRHFRESMLEKIAQLGLQDRILWHPFVDDVSVVWSACDIAVAPSTEPEPFGRVAIEAMAYRLPVVAAGHGGLAEIVQHEATGLLVKPGDATELAEAIARLAASPALRAAYGDAGRARQRSEFTQQQHDAKLLELIARCTDARD